ncbi:MAG: hypothetical protein BYD32DRAFT_432250 [Podila humilis]|nr:MAG: hypothetical protein BYD32DRAFT_432250 [Podila humilis]
MDVGFAITSHMFLGSHVDACFTRGLGLASLQAYARLREEAKVSSKEEVPPKEANQDPTHRATGPQMPFALSVGLHPRHPARILLGAIVTPAPAQGGFLLCTRIPSYTTFILKVAPELERRLALSPSLARISDMLHGDFFCQVEGSWGKGFEIVLEGGKIHSATEWKKQSPEEALVERLQWKKQGKSPLVRQATFPPLIYSHLLVGRLGLEDLVFGDVSVGDSMTWLVWGTVPQGRSPFG